MILRINVFFSSIVKYNVNVTTNQPIPYNLQNLPQHLPILYMEYIFPLFLE